MPSTREYIVGVSYQSSYAIDLSFQVWGVSTLVDTPHAERIYLTCIKLHLIHRFRNGLLFSYMLLDDGLYSCLSLLA